MVESNHISPPPPLPPTAHSPPSTKWTPRATLLKTLQSLQVASRFKSNLCLGLQSLVWADSYLTLSDPWHPLCTLWASATQPFILSLQMQDTCSSFQEMSFLSDVPSAWDALLLHPHVSGSIFTFHAQKLSLTMLFSHPCLPPFLLNPCDVFHFS